MTETAIHPSPNVLRRLSTLRELPPDELTLLSDRLLVHEARKGEVILPLGVDDDCTLYLLEGSCRLTAEDGGVKVIRHTDPSALAPLARLRPSHYRVTAESLVQYLRIDNGLVQQAVGKLEQPTSLTLETYQVEEEDDFGHGAAENRLTVQIYEDLNTEHLLLPSLPQVAVRIGEAVNHDNADARRVAGLIETDPAIALKIVKAANSARYGGVSRAATVTEAVTRLGLHNTRILVLAFALRELFRTPSKMLELRMLELWEHSRRIAALAHVLAAKVSGVNTHEALLAGLVHDIGTLAVIGYARDFPEVAEDRAALESSIQALRAQIGGMILAKWQLPAELVTAAKEAENWYRQHSGPADYADLVVVAQLHEGVGGDIDPDRIPALGRLGLTASGLEGGVEQLLEADEELAEARALLAS
jgi:HD-like signal output (HDOD) protein